MLIIPNIIWSKNKPKDYYKYLKNENKVLLLFERIGEKQTISDTPWPIYDEAKTYHDGKWIMFESADTSMFDDFMKLLGIKRKPNRKSYV